MNAAIHPRPAAERAPSYYAATLNEETDYPTLLGAVTVDIAIIGGGFTGVATAVELAERGYKVALVETHRIGWAPAGATAARSPAACPATRRCTSRCANGWAPRSRTSSGTCAGAATRSSASGWRSTASPATFAMATCTRR